MNRCVVPSLVVFCLVALAVPAAAQGPVITGFTPTSGPPGTTVTVTGSTFNGATVVAFGSAAATFIVDSDTQITATVPPLATSGPISVTAPGGTATSSTFTVCQQADTTITAPAGVCINSSGNVASVPAQSGATYTWTVNPDGTLTGGQGTNSITFTAGTLPYVNIDVAVTTSCGTSYGSHGVETSPPTALLTTQIVCPNTTGNVASVRPVPGTTYSWTLTGPGSITSGANTNSMTYSAAGPGQIQLGITASNSCGTSTNTWLIAVGTAVIQTNDRVCATAPSPYRAAVPWDPGASYFWTISGGTFTPDSNLTTPWVKFTPGASGSVTLTATITGAPCGPYTVTKTIPIDSSSTAIAMTAPAVVCANSTSNTASATPLTGAVYNWWINNGTITSGQGTSSIAFTAGGDGSVFLGVHANLACGVADATTIVPINADTTITVPASVCINSSGNVASVPAQSGASYLWAVNNGTLTGGQGTNSITFTAGTLAWVNIGVAVTTSCGTAHGARGFETSPPTGMIAAQIVCPNTTGNVASVTLLPGTTYSWTLSGPGTITSGANTNSITFSAAGPGQIQLGITSTNSCGTSTNTYPVTVGTPTIQTADRVCATAPSPYGANVQWTPEASYLWTISGGTFTPDTNATGNFVNFTPGASGSVTLTATITGVACGPYTVTKTIPIDSSSTAIAMTAPAVVCANSTSNTASATSLTGAVYNWWIGNGTITGGQGTSSITFTAGSSGTVFLNVNAGLGCGGVGASASVPINADATITAAADFCINSTGNAASVPAQSGASYVWTINGGTITSATNTNSITFTAFSGRLINLGVTVTTSCGSAGNSVWIPTSPVTSPMTETIVCPNTTHTATLPADDKTTSYNWSISGTGASITSATNTSSITYVVGSSPVQLTVTSGGTCGTATNTTNIDVGSLTIYAPDRVCATGSNYGANVNGTSDVTYAWTITGGTLTSPATGWGVNFAPNAGAATVTLSITVSGLSCGPLTASKTIPIDSSSATIAMTAPAVVCANSTSNSASATPLTGVVYNWWIGNGTITSGQGTSSIMFTAGSGGTVNLNVNANLGCGNVSASANVPINADATITAAADFCINSTGNVASVPAQSGASYVWTVNNGTLTGGQGSNSITFTAGTDPYGNINVAVTTSCGTAHGSRWFETSPPVANLTTQFVCPNSTGNVASVTLLPGTTYSWTLTGPGSITSGANTNSMTYSATGPGQIQLGITATNSCGTSTNTWLIAAGTPAILTNDRVCATTPSPYNAWLPWAPGASYLWTISGGTFTPDSSATNNSVNFTPDASGSVTLTATISGVACGPYTVTKTIPIDDPATQMAITAPASVCPGSTANTASATAVSGLTYYWSVGSQVMITAPSAVAGNYYALGAAFGPPLPTTGLTGELVIGQDPADTAGPSTTDACSPLTNAVSGKIVVVDRGTCYFVNKVEDAQAAGAIAVIVVNNVTGGPIVMAGTGTAADATLTIPAVMVSLDDGNLFKANVPFNATLKGTGTITAGQGTNAITFTAGGSGSVQLVVDTSLSCGTGFAAANVPMATATITAGGPTTLCAGGSVTLTASAGAGYRWFNNGTLIPGANAVAYVANSGGSYTVQVTDTNGCSAVSAPTVVATTTASTPTITNINPTSGPAAGGQSVTVTGTNLSGATVTIGGSSAAATGTATTATFTTPAHAAGAVDVTVTTACGSATSTGGYTYVAQADIEIGKTVDNTSPVVGQQVVFTITATNHGPADASGLQVTDALPSALLFNSSAPSSGTTFDPITGLWKIGTLANGASASLSIHVVVMQTGSITNTAAKTAQDELDPNGSNDTHSVTINGQPAADIVVQKSVDHAQPLVGSSVMFTITATNNGPNDATGVQVTDPLPSGLTFVSATPQSGTTYDTTSGLWNIGAIAKNAVNTLAVVAAVSQSGTNTNTATKTHGNEFDPNTSNDSSTASINAAAASDIAVSKIVDQSNVFVGTDVNFTITALNRGPSDATGVRITDLLPTGLLFVSATPTTGTTYDPTTGLWTVGAIANGASKVLLVKATAMQSGPLINSATRTASDQTDVNAANDSASATVNASPSADVSVAKSASNSSPSAGQNVSFTITATNHGPSPATSVAVTDLLPSALLYVSSMASTGTYDPVTGIWNVGSLANSASATLQITTTVQVSGSITNTATRSGQTDTDPNASNDSSSVTITVPGTPTTTSLTSSQNPAATGASVTFTATVSTSGKKATGNVTFWDGSTLLGSSALNNQGSATFTTSTLATGTHSTVAQYDGGVGFDPSTSAPLAEAIKGATATTFNSSPNPSSVGQAVVLQATVNAVAPATGVPTGSVTFFDGKATLGTSSLSGGAATLTISSFSKGKHQLTATYNGDPTFLGSSSTTVGQMIK